MLDETDGLQCHAALMRLLTLYASLAAPNRDAWQPRLTTVEGIAPEEMTRLHGDLLVLGWIEWTSGQVVPNLGGVMACYRITIDGLRACRLASGVAVPETNSETKPRKSGRRPRETTAPELTIVNG